MEELFFLEKSFIDKHGKFINLKLYEADNLKNVMCYRCVLNGETEMLLSIDDDGNWIDTKNGVTKLSCLIGNIIEDNFE
jgi:hypothetical protein